MNKIDLIFNKIDSKSLVISPFVLYILSYHELRYLDGHCACVARSRRRSRRSGRAIK